LLAAVSYYHFHY